MTYAMDNENDPHDGSQQEIATQQFDPKEGEEYTPPSQQKDPCPH